MDATFQFTVNGRPRTVTTDPVRPLLDVIREDLQLTGTKYGCGEGKCGACTVLVEGKRTFSCRTSVEDAANRSITTIEGLAKGETLHPVQEAFLECNAFQCGYCTSGMIMGTVALLNKQAKPSESEITEWMNAHVCRCCSYVTIHQAVTRAAEKAGR